MICTGSSTPCVTCGRPARLHVREETLFYTGPRVTVADLVARQR